MTVCVAALASWQDTDGSPAAAIILVADRMVTARRIREYEFADQAKIVWYRQNLAVLLSGSLDSLFLAYRNAELRLTKDCTVQDLAKVIAEEVQTIRRRDVERLYFQQYGLTIDTFVSRQRQWTPDFFERLHARIEDHDNDLGEVIVAGFDDDTAHIFTIEGAGWERAWDGTGFCAIGIGAEHAEAEFAHASYTPKKDWVSAMRIAFFAKKRAEEAPGVGSITDLWHITKQGHRYYWPESRVVQGLTTMYMEARAVEIGSIQSDGMRLNAILGEEYRATTPSAATEEERKAAEAKAEEADAAADSPRIPGDAGEG